MAPDDRESFREARAAGLKARQERRLENATYTTAEVKVLTEAALRLGRKEALDHAAEAIQTEIDEFGDGEGEEYFEGLRRARRITIDSISFLPRIGSPDATSGRTDPNSTSAMLKSLEGR